MGIPQWLFTIIHGFHNLQENLSIASNEILVYSAYTEIFKISLVIFHNYNAVAKLLTRLTPTSR